MYERILLPTDGSTVAEAAADAALAFAERFGAELHVVHVLDLVDVPSRLEDDATDLVTRRGERAVESVAERATDAGIDVETAVLEYRRPVHWTLVDYAEDHDVDCIVMGTYGRTGVDRYLLGSVAEYTLRESPVPVLTVHEETVVDLDFEDVLVPTDGSETATAAVDEAVELAVETGAALHVVHVVDVGALGGTPDAGAALEALEAAGERAIQAAVERADAAGVSTVEASVLTGAPHRAVLDYADERSVDCIVMGTHGRQGLDRVLLGSVTERVVRLAHVPVLATKPRDTAFDEE